MKTTPWTLAISFLACALAVPSAAAPPGHLSLTFEFPVVSSLDFKDGVGVADPADRNSPCTALLLGVSVVQPLVSPFWELDQDMGTNLNGPGVGISNLAPPLSPPGGWLSSSGGIDLGVPCPIPGSGTGSLWIVWSGMNWRSAEHASPTDIRLCTQQSFISSSPGCLALPSGNLALMVAACTGVAAASFDHDYLDNKGKNVGGHPYDTLLMLNKVLRCPVRHAHDYTSTVQEFGSGRAAQTFDTIKNEAVVHTTSGTTYMAVCWSIDYVDFTNPLAPVTLTAETHDWKLILDLDDPAGSASYIAALQAHYGGQRPGDGGVGGPTVALRGFYDQSGDNGFGPCPASASLPETKKPAAFL